SALPTLTTLKPSDVSALAAACAMPALPVPFSTATSISLGGTDRLDPDFDDLWWVVPGSGWSLRIAAQSSGALVGSHSTSPYGRPGASVRVGTVRIFTPPAPTLCSALASCFIVPSPNPSVVSELAAADRNSWSRIGLISRLVLVALRIMAPMNSC